MRVGSRAETVRGVGSPRLGSPLPATDRGNWCSERIRQLREGYRLSQEGLARALGVSLATVRRWETEKTRPTGLSITALSVFEAEGMTAPVALRGIR